MTFGKNYVKRRRKEGNRQEKLRKIKGKYKLKWKSQYKTGEIKAKRVPKG
jgi:hypothetical protein